MSSQLLPKPEGLWVYSIISLSLRWHTNTQKALYLIDSSSLGLCQPCLGASPSQRHSFIGRCPVSSLQSSLEALAGIGNILIRMLNHLNLSELETRRKILSLSLLYMCVNNLVFFHEAPLVHCAFITPLVIPIFFLSVTFTVKPTSFAFTFFSLPLLEHPTFYCCFVYFAVQFSVQLIWIEKTTTKQNQPPSP